MLGSNLVVCKHLLNQWQIERLTRTGLWNTAGLGLFGHSIGTEKTWDRTTAATSVSTCSSSGSHTCDCFLYLASGELLSFGAGSSIRRPKTKPKQEEESL